MKIYKPEIDKQHTRHETKDASNGDLVVFEFHDRPSVSIQLQKVKEHYASTGDYTLTPFVVLNEQTLKDLLKMVQRNKRKALKTKDARGNV